MPADPPADAARYLPNSGLGVERRPYVRVPHGAPRRGQLTERLHYKLTVAYEGTDFFGWQRQDPPDAAPRRTVQGVLEGTLRVWLSDAQIMVHGASRTDSGVHALGQCATFKAAVPLPVDRLAHALNARLPADLVIRAAETVADDFNVCSDAKMKQYRYRIHHGETPPVLTRRFVHQAHLPPGQKLDLGAMQDGARRLLGRIDMAAFSSARHERTTTERHIHACRLEVATDNPHEVHLVIQGDGFLYNSVRIIAGTLLEIGRGHFKPEQVDVALSEKNRRYAGPTLPAHGLCLEWVGY